MLVLVLVGLLLTIAALLAIVTAAPVMVTMMVMMMVAVPSISAVVAVAAQRDRGVWRRLLWSVLGVRHSLNLIAGREVEGGARRVVANVKAQAFIIVVHDGVVAAVASITHHVL